MKSAILADTGPLYAAADIDDQYHSRAQDELGRLAEARMSILLPYPVMLEAYSLVLFRLGRQFAGNWLDEINSGVALVNPLPEDYFAAQLKINAYPDQRITLFDGVLAALADRLECTIWTYDFHFDVMRADVWR